EAARVLGHPPGVDAVHLADRAAAGKAMNKGHEAGLALVLEDLENGEVERVVRPEMPAHLVLASAQHLVERAALPIGRRLAALVGAAIFDDRILLDAVISPTEGPPLIDRMERVDDGDGARQREPGGTAAGTEAVQELG